MSVGIIVVCGHILASCWFVEDCKTNESVNLYEEMPMYIEYNPKYEECFKLSYKLIFKYKEMKSQVLNRKPMLIRARTTC
ncbi:TPA: hypothetical protein ACLQU7_005242 [Bacillus tropicus]|uniref:hypothetical protein n=1 Tax=Bacillus tropicus TaxID=2026188 RepID=UPI0002EE4468|nr:hypothetical protein NT98_5868 [Bacillus cereus]AJI02675.1 hypothetical protein AQ16_5896 [Bacillus cereus G9241]ARO21555.1 hypothetical protein B2J90_29540 [Bacillus cereus]KDB41017.1 hypothetical protein DH31_12310 [Bacillus cereus]